MDATASGAPTVQYHNIVDQPITPLVVVSPLPTFQRQQRHCFGESSPGEFPLAASPSIVLHVLTSCNLDPQDLAKLEATCSFFRHPANFTPDVELSIAELAALDMCQMRAIFKLMTAEEHQDMKQRCGGSWKLVLRFLLAGEACCRREKSQAIAGPGHSIAVTSKGAVYSFGSNSSGQLGHGTLEEEWRPRKISSLQGIRIIQAAAGAGRTMLISDAGRVYAFGKDSFGEADYVVQGVDAVVSTPQPVESLKDIFVVQAAIGNFFTAVLSREGRVYTFSWGSDQKLGHQTQPSDREPRPLLGPLENIPVVQIAAGYCYLLALLLSTTILYPLDTCKTKYQAEAQAHGQQKYRNLTDVLLEAISNHRILSLYQGLGIKNLQSFVSQFVYFYGYSYFKRLYLSRSGTKSMGTKANIIVAAAAGACTVIITQPLDTASSRIQTSAFGKSKGLWQTLSEGTWSEAFDGLGISLLLTSNPAIQYTVFDQLKQRLLLRGSQRNKTGTESSPEALSAFSAFVLGAVSKSVATFLTYPAIRCKVVIQAADAEDDGNKETRSKSQKTVSGVIYDIWRKEGVLGFFKGLHAQILKTVLSSALLLMIKEKITKTTWVLMLALRRYLLLTPSRLKGI